jgi:hypothetical protein
MSALPETQSHGLQGHRVTQRMRSAIQAIQQLICSYLLKGYSHAKQLFPDNKKNYKASDCADTTQGNVGFPLFPQAPRRLAKG